MHPVSAAIGQDAVAVLRLLALDGALRSTVKVSCSGLAERLDVSNQTASRRLQQLDDAGLIERELAADGQWIDLTDSGHDRLRAEYEAYRRIFESPPTVELTGTVTAGMGDGKHYISLSGYQTQFSNRLGYTPYPGTLNVRLIEESVRKRPALSAIDAIPIDGWEDDDRTFGPAHCYPAMLTNQSSERYDEAHVIIPERTHHDETKIELIAPDRLRDSLHLADDDQLTITVSNGAEQ